MSQGLTPSMRSAVCVDLGLTDYGRALNIQYDLVNSKTEQPDHTDVLLLVEHPSVFTLGKRGGAENLIMSESFLKGKNIEVVQTTRGGNITYHGPGQAVFYPVVDLERAGIGVKDFVHGLEQVLINTLADVGISSGRNEKNHGVWVGDQKIASVGISIKQGISFHGIALNAFVDLTPFSWIRPCGMENVSMTSVGEQLPQTTKNFLPLTVKDIFQKILDHFQCIFDYTIDKNGTDSIQKIKTIQTCMA